MTKHVCLKQTQKVENSFVSETFFCPMTTIAFDDPCCKFPEDCITFCQNGHILFHAAKRGECFSKERETNCITVNVSTGQINWNDKVLCSRFEKQTSFVHRTIKKVSKILHKHFGDLPQIVEVLKRGGLLTISGFRHNKVSQMIHALAFSQTESLAKISVSRSPVSSSTPPASPCPGTKKLPSFPVSENAETKKTATQSVAKKATVSKKAETKKATVPPVAKKAEAKTTGLREAVFVCLEGHPGVFVNIFKKCVAIVRKESGQFALLAVQKKINSRFRKSIRFDSVKINEASKIHSKAANDLLAWAAREKQPNDKIRVSS